MCEVVPNASSSAILIVGTFNLISSGTRAEDETVGESSTVDGCFIKTAVVVVVVVVVVIMIIMDVLR